MKTLGGYDVINFKKLKTPIDRNVLEPHIYEGIIVNLKRYDGENKDQYLTWDKFGRCSNFERRDCFIDINKINTLF